MKIILHMQVYEVQASIRLVLILYNATDVAFVYM